MNEVFSRQRELMKYYGLAGMVTMAPEEYRLHDRNSGPFTIRYPQSTCNNNSLFATKSRVTLCVNVEERTREKKTVGLILPEFLVITSF